MKRMYGIPEDIDLSFLKGKELIQVCIGLHQAVLVFHEETKITIETEIRHQKRDEKITIYDHTPASATALASMIGSQIVDVKKEGIDFLTLRFSNGDLLRLFDDGDRFESFQIMNKGRSIIV